MSLTERSKSQYDTSPEAAFLKPRPPLPTNMMVELSNACNHACVFCPNPHMTRSVGRIDRDLLFRVMDEAAAAGVTDIGFYTTGDPFVHKGLAEFTAHAKRAGFSYIYISTNGALASPDRAKAVIDAGMHSIKFSINAGSRETYREIHGRDDWDTVVANLKFISDYRKTAAPHLKLYITCVVTKTIEHEVPAIKAMFAPLVDEIWCDPCTPLAWPDAAVGGNPGVCHLPFNRLHVTQEGYLTLCCVDFQNYLAVADLNKHALADAWHSAEFAAIRERHLKRDLAGTLCGRCWLGDRAKVAPLDAALAAPLDHDEYERVQRERVMGELRTEKARA